MITHSPPLCQVPSSLVVGVVKKLSGLKVQVVECSPESHQSLLVKLPGLGLME